VSGTSGAQAKPPPLVHLPADQAAHTSARNEWWYVVGHLKQGAHRFGYELTVFKFDHVRPPGMSAPVTIYRTDMAITDETAKRFYHHIAYYFPSGQTLSTHVLDVRVGNAALSGGLHAMHLRTAFPGGQVRLTLTSRKPAMDVGGRGYLPFANGSTYYYSLTDLASRGSLTVGGQRYSVSGISWLDHQWGNWSWASMRGWTWMALQLHNNVQLSVFDFRGAKGDVKEANVLLPNGTLRVLHAVTITPSGIWNSPHTGAAYPDSWIVSIPALHARLNVTPAVADQEMTAPGERRASYWEGSGQVAGTYAGKPVTGLSYTELTGYAK
jgi:predicted secreted hydrolase